MSKKKGQYFVQNRSLVSLQTAFSITICLPKQISFIKMNKTLMTHYLKQKILNKKVTINQFFVALYLGKQHTFTITAIEGHDHLKSNQSLITMQTQIHLQEYSLQNIQNRFYPLSQLYGLKSEYQALKRAIHQSLFQRQSLLKRGLNPLKGVLIGGYSGTGKTALLHKLRSQLQKDVYFHQISAVNMLSKLVGGAQQYIRSLFKSLREKERCVLIIEDIHLIFGRKESSSHQTTLAALFIEMDNIIVESIVILATYNASKELDDSLRAYGKFEKDITLQLPNHTQRLAVLEGLIEEMNAINVQREGLRELNLRLNGFSIGEIKQILREAYTIDQDKVNINTIFDVLKQFKPAQIKSLIVQVPQVKWNQIGGYQQVKKSIRKATELPLKHPQVFKRFGIEQIKGILLYGPPGCSKTMMAKAIATESKLNFIGIKGPQLFSKYVGDSEQAIRNIFKRARACSPCIIFFDEIDALASQRSANTEVSDRVLCQLLNEMDGIQGLKEVVVVAATNRPQVLDQALMRPGRFDYLIYVGPPDLQAREEIFKLNCKKCEPNIELLLAQKTQDYTGAQIALVCREAALIAIQANIQCQIVEFKCFEKALKKIKNRLTKESISHYEEFESKLKYSQQ